MNIDVRTLAVVLGITSILQVFAFLLQYHVNKSYRGIGWWAFGYALVAVGFVLLILRDVVSVALITIILPNILLVLGSTIIYVGTKQFFGKSVDRTVIFVFTGFLLSFFYYTYVDSSITARTSVVTATCAVIAFMTAHGLFRNRINRTIRSSVNFTSAVFLAFACFSAYRSLVTLTLSPVSSLFTPSLMQTSGLLVPLVLGILSTFGLIIMVNQRSNMEMKEAKEHFEAIFNTSPDASLICSLEDGVVVNVNKAFMSLFGFSRDDIIGKSCANIGIWVNPSDRQHVEDELKENGYCRNFEAKFKSESGDQFTGLMSAEIISLNDIPHIIGVTRDISDRKGAEEALRESEERHRSIFENSLDGIILSFPDGRILAANPEACRMHGYTEAEICRRGRDGIADRSDPRLSKLLEDRFRTGKHRGEVTHVRRDGTKFPCETSSAVFKDKHGQKASVLILRDITERKRAEEALREGERSARRASDVNMIMAELGRIIGSTLRIEKVYEQFAAVVKRIISFDRIMIGLMDDQQQTWKIAYVSGITAEGRQVGDVLPLTGFIRDVIGKRSGTLLHLENEEELAERYPLLVPAFRAGTKTIMAAPLISKDQVIGTIQFSSLTPGAYTEEDLILAGNVAGQISGAIANAQLFAKYERSEEELRRSRDELELRVKKRTAELARKNEELQNFTFAASHDLQEPLRKIQTLSDFISTRYSDSVSEQGRDYLRRMHDTATRMRDVLQSLLDYSRLTRTVHSFGRVDLNKIAREAVSDFELSIRETGASVEIGNLPEIEGDAAQMRQLFQNLIGNALKFRREAIQPLVKIYAAYSSSKGEWEICISDNGIGFDEKYQDLIFKPFQRLHGKDEFGGNGMGLAICTKVIEHHKGFITARSVLGEGSTFIVTLPVAGTTR